MQNKLGFYSHKTSVELEWAIRNIRPPVILAHAEDASFWRRVRQEWNPEAFIIGRIIKDTSQQNHLFKEMNPAEGARHFADEVLSHEIAQQQVDGRPIFDAWLALNESVPGPQHFEDKTDMADIYHRYDTFQVVFAEELRDAGLEAVAMNVGAGNFSDGRVWLDHFPGTLETCTYLGFHEYGWPTMWPDDPTRSGTSCLLYRQVMPPIRERYGHKHKVIITECGLARMYFDTGAGDVGWRYPDGPSPEDYWASLKWYNEELNEDPYVLGGCIFQVGHGPRWETFETLGTPIIGWLQELVEQQEVPEEVVVTAAPPALLEESIDAFRQEALTRLDALERKVDELQALLEAYRDFLQGR